MYEHNVGIPSNLLICLYFVPVFTEMFVYTYYTFIIPAALYLIISQVITLKAS